jgi:hypothetical protein
LTCAPETVARVTQELRIAKEEEDNFWRMQDFSRAAQASKRIDADLSQAMQQVLTGPRHVWVLSWLRGLHLLICAWMMEHQRLNVWESLQNVAKEWNLCYTPHVRR